MLHYGVDPHFKPQGILFTISDDDSARPSGACSFASD
jgi:hypothetical protein